MTCRHYNKELIGFMSYSETTKLHICALFKCTRCNKLFRSKYGVHQGIVSQFSREYNYPEFPDRHETMHLFPE